MTQSEESSASNTSDAAPASSAALSGDAPPSNESAKAQSASESSAPIIALPIVRPPQDEAEPAEPPPQPTPRRYAALAAGLSLAVAIGAVAGAMAMAGLSRDQAPAAAAVAAQASRDLQAGMTKLEAEFAALKAGVGASQGSAGAQFAKLTERLERAEKAQAEPAAKIAKIAEGLERLERRLPQHAAADVTGSVAAKQEAKPPVAPPLTPPPLAQGWRLLDVYAGRAVVENRDGREFEVRPGSNLPGLGRVEGIARENGKYLVVTRNGIIAGAFERGRPGYFYRD